jgi:hypothetical protein
MFDWILRISAAVLAVGLSVAPGHAEVRTSIIDIGLPNTVVIKINGGFDGNELLRVKSAIAQIPPGKRVIAALESPGGYLFEGEQLGRFFYEAKIPTIVFKGDDCASACTAAFFGGRDPVTGKSLRILATGAKLGFHNLSRRVSPDAKFSSTQLLELSRSIQRDVYRNLQHFRAVNAPWRVLKLSMGTKSSDMRFLTESEALDHGIAILNRETGKLTLPDNLLTRTESKP